MADHFADRITEAMQTKCTQTIVGIDPVYSKLPKSLISQSHLNDGSDVGAAIDAIFEFSTKVMNIVAPLVPAVKLNSAFFERYLWEGVECYYSLVQEASALGLEVIGDVKRGDIGSTAGAYAAGHIANYDFVDLDDLNAPDAITISGFAGAEGIIPFADAAIDDGKAVFVWVRASNPSAKALSDFTNSDGKKYYEALAEQVATIACEPKYLGASGYSNIGMVIGGTTAAETASLREQYPHIMFLVPGYGSQGASAADCLAFAKPEDGTGCLINASRSIIYAYDNPTYQEQYGDNWEKCIEQACLDMKADIANCYA